MKQKIKHTNLVCLWGIVSLCLFLTFGGEAAAALNEEQKRERALTFISTNGTAMLEIMKNEKLSKQKKRRKLKTILENNLDLETMARAIVGPYWRKMNEQERERYSNTSVQWMLLYASNVLSSIKPAKFKVLSASPLGKDVLVATQTHSKNASEPFVMQWRVRFKSDDTPVLLDLHFRGLSMIAAQRSEASILLAEKGIPVFLDTIDERLEKIIKEFQEN